MHCIRMVCLTLVIKIFKTENMFIVEKSGGGGSSRRVYISLLNDGKVVNVGLGITLAHSN